MRVLGAPDQKIGAQVLEAYATSAPVAGKVMGFKSDGTPLNAQITQVKVPSALAYDSRNDRLLLCDNSPSQQVVAFKGLDGTPVLDTTFASKGYLGEHGGIYAGPGPRVGLWGPGRFDGLRGVHWTARATSTSECVGCSAPIKLASKATRLTVTCAENAGTGVSR